MREWTKKFNLSCTRSVELRSQRYRAEAYRADAGQSYEDGQAEGLALRGWSS